jgi:squalene-hopene/tetraprenyl-beta-curcumene cyclase
MLDDLLDWKEDLQTGIPSLLLSRLIDESPRNKSQKELEQLNQRLAHEIYYRGHAHYVLELALKFLDEAEVLRDELPDLLWWNVTSKLRHKCQTLIQDIEQIIHKNLERVQKQPKFNLTLPPTESQWQQLAWNGLRFIIKQWRC